MHNPHSSGMMFFCTLAGGIGARGGRFMTIVHPVPRAAIAFTDSQLPSLLKDDAQQRTKNRLPNCVDSSVTMKHVIGQPYIQIWHQTDEGASSKSQTSALLRHRQRSATFIIQTIQYFQSLAARTVVTRYSFWMLVR